MKGTTEKYGAEIIADNMQVTLFGGFAPNSSSIEIMFKALGSRTVLSGSVSRSKGDSSQSFQMIERPLMTPDELKVLPKGEFIVMKAGVHPMKVKLKPYFKWGIEFDTKHPYSVPDSDRRKAQYAKKMTCWTQSFGNISRSCSMTAPPPMTAMRKSRIREKQSGMSRLEPFKRNWRAKG